MFLDYLGYVFNNVSYPMFDYKVLVCSITVFYKNKADEKWTHKGL